MIVVSELYGIEGMALSGNNQTQETEARIGRLIDQGRLTEALGECKIAVSMFPQTRAFMLLLAKAYILDNNSVWALKTLYGWINDNPDDHEVRSWITWLHMQRGEMDKASAQSEQYRLAEWPSLISRDNLYQAFLALSAKDLRQARFGFKSAFSGQAGFPEDEALAGQIGAALFPQWQGKYHLTVSGVLGYSTHPSLAATFGEDVTAAGSPYSGLTASATIDPLLTYPVRPVIMFKQTASYYTENQGADKPSASSFFFPEFRVSFPWRAGFVEAAVAYASGAYLLNSRPPFSFPDTTWMEEFFSERAYWFFEYHRFEADLRISDGIAALYGFGRRWFNHMGRSRYENDLTFAWQIPYRKYAEIVAALSGRYYHATNDNYSITGGDCLVSLERRISGKLSAAVSVIGGLDHYPKSLDFFLASVTRFDRLAVLQTKLRYAFRKSIRIVVSYEFSDRRSNASSASDNFDYRDHRIQAGLEWSAVRGVWLRTASDSDMGSRVTLPYEGISGSDHIFDAVRELLKHRQELRRSSTCLN